MTKSQRYRVLGVDPGLNITGYGIVDFASAAGRPAIVEGGAIRTNSKADVATRIEQIHSDVTTLIDEFGPDLVAIENLYAHYAHPRTSILMAHARGVILLAAQQAGVAVRGLAATKVKKSLTGNGHATKLQMQRAIQAVCRLENLPEPPDVADALAIALCAGRQI
ncbi:MAG: crossover junction endodeoxyribonuclease RuvC [Phycisphaerae bacterium]|jgi:crossover junction endodeoxyribonuclease RuvC|nr:crossover junction endodeoxyribonuclease RuvC [Phycisphaerae bacterium]MDP7289600.1 crossover junction endodeoxyribonuclease RuvC [Phycisphaerae bacterium]